MRTSPALLAALPALAAAQQQFPFVNQIKGFFGQASASASSAVHSSLPTDIPMPDPIAAGASKIADAKVNRITLDNYHQILVPGAATASPGIEDWMVYVTGGNKSCFGVCERADKAWVEAVPLISASRSPPHLGMIDCEVDGVLCQAWAISPPQVMHIQLPQPLPDQSTPATTVRYMGLNRTTVTATEIAGIHLQETYKEKEPYEGVWHPFDGFLAQNHLLIPVGYAIWGFSRIPSWAIMIGVSFLSRTMM